MHSSGTEIAEPITYTTIRDLQRVAAIAEPWDALLDHSPCNRVFSSSTWLLGICRNDISMTPYVIAAWRGDQLAGIFPLVQWEASGLVTFPPFFGDYNDIVADCRDLNVVNGLLRHALAEENRLLLNCLPSNSNCCRSVQTMWPGNTEKSLQVEHTCSYISLAGGYEQYLASRSYDFRRKLKYAERKAAANGMTAVELTPQSYSPHQLPEDFLFLHLQRFTEMSSFRTIPAQAFVRETFPRLFQQRRLRVFAIYAENTMVAIDLCPVGYKSLCAWNGGFLPEVAHWSPGKLLIAEEIRQAFAMGMEEFDFLRGVHPYKTRWATSRRSTMQLDLSSAGEWTEAQTEISRHQGIFAGAESH